MTPSFLQSRLDLACEPSAVRRARHHTAEVLGQRDTTALLVEDALLIVSELMTNAVKHARIPLDAGNNRPELPRCTLNLWTTATHLIIAVYDQDRRPPVPRQSPDDAENGRGLTLVDTLSDGWGYSYPSPDSGKLVWAKMPLPTRPERKVTTTGEGTGAATVRGSLQISAQLTSSTAYTAMTA